MDSRAPAGTRVITIELATRRGNDGIVVDGSDDTAHTRNAVAGKCAVIERNGVSAVAKDNHTAANVFPGAASTNLGGRIVGKRTSIAGDARGALDTHDAGGCGGITGERAVVEGGHGRTAGVEYAAPAGCGVVVECTRGKCHILHTCVLNGTGSVGCSVLPKSASRNLYMSMSPGIIQLDTRTVACMVGLKIAI